MHHIKLFYDVSILVTGIDHMIKQQKVSSKRHNVHCTATLIGKCDDNGRDLYKQITYQLHRWLPRRLQ